MAENAIIPPLPEGFVINNTPPLPEGFVLSQPQSQQEPQSVSNQIGDRLLQAKQAITGEDNPVSNAIQFGGAIGGAANDLGRDALGYIGSKIAEAQPATAFLAKAGAAIAGHQISDSAVGDVARQYANSYNNFTQSHPELGRDISAIGNMTAGFPLIKGAGEAGASLADNLGTSIADSLAPKMPFDKNLAQASISKSYGDALAQTKPFYDFVEKSAGNQTADLSNLQPHLQSMISEIGSDPYHQSRSVLPRLQAFSDQIAQNPNVPLSDIVDMKQQINSGFNDNKLSQGAKTPTFQVGRMLDSTLNSASQSNPIFGKALELANKQYVDNVATPFDNSVLNKFWKPEDYHAQNGIGSIIPDATQQRAYNLLNNIKNPVQLNAVTRVMPEDLATQTRQALASQLTAGKGMYRLEQFGNIAGDPLGSIKHVFNAIRGQTYSPDVKALISATKEVSPSAVQYGDALGALQKQQEIMPFDNTPKLTYNPAVIPVNSQGVPMPNPNMRGAIDKTNPNIIDAAQGRQQLAAELTRQKPLQLEFNPTRITPNGDVLQPPQMPNHRGYIGVNEITPYSVINKYNEEQAAKAYADYLANLSKQRSGNY